MHALIAAEATLLLLRDDLWDRLRALRDEAEANNPLAAALLLDQAAQDMAFEAAYLASLATSLRSTSWP